MVEALVPSSKTALIKTTIHANSPKRLNLSYRRQTSSEMDTKQLLFLSFLGLLAPAVRGQTTQAQINQLRSSVTRLTTQVNSLGASVTQVQTQTQTLTTQSAQQQGQINGLSASVAALQVNNSAQQHEISELQAARSSLESRLTQVEAVNANQSAFIDVLVAEVGSLQQSNQQLQGQVTSLSSTVADLLARENAQDQRLNSLTDRVTATESGLQDLTGQVSALNRQVSGLQSLPGEVSSLRSDVAALTGTVAGLTADLAALNSTVQGLQSCCDRVEALNASLVDLQVVVAGLGASVGSLTSTVDVLGDDLDSLNSSLISLSNSTTISLQNLSTQIIVLQNQINLDGSTFVRWGRDSCPSNSTLVYSGLVAGKDTNDKGSGSNLLCLPNGTQPDAPTSETSSNLGRLYTARYGISNNSLRNYAVPCSQCRTSLPTTIVVPGNTQCPAGWTQQYAGRLVSPVDVSQFATEYVCLDQNAQTASSNNLAIGVKVSRLHYVGAQTPVNTVFSCFVCSK